MQLKELKLAGFKSFVDPTVVPFPSQLVAVVGPNGCGKSNVIDAVRWVMGESSAKNLRGESMADVIFNGSTNRKAVGQASVELVFDNSLGRLTGQYGSYQEIAVKRIVTRDGDSSYYLNGTRCRRKDITDIFLGTGAGARGYSIIGQGTISRIVEARPEELRAYLEEAAGVSKYKERRRETLLRINHTRENLARVADIRDELDKQLQRLERQAKAAERYKILKSEERLFKSQILALKWKDYTAEQSVKQQEINQFLTEYEKHKANAAGAFKQSTLFREKLHDDNEIFQQIQSHFYQLATEIARLEEIIQQNQREKRSLQNDKQQIQIDWQNANNQIVQDKEMIQESEQVLEKLDTTLGELQLEFSEKERILKDLELEQTNWNSKNQEIQSLLNKSLSEIQVGQIRSQHIIQQRQQLLTRLEKIEEENKISEIEILIDHLKVQKSSSASLADQLQQDEFNYQIAAAELENQRKIFAETQNSLHHCQDTIHDLSAKQAALFAAQQAALTESKEPNEHQLWKEKSRLVETIQVEKEWQYACELVLGEALQALVFDSLDPIWCELKDNEVNSALLITSSSQIAGKSKYPRLIDKISGVNPNWLHTLDKIYAAKDHKEAISWLIDLEDSESVITPDGYWLAKGWAKIAKPLKTNHTGLLLRQEELTETNETLAISQAKLNELKLQRDELHLQLKTSEQHLELQKQALSKTREEYRIVLAEITSKERTLQQSEHRQNLLIDEKAELLATLEGLAQEQEQIEFTLNNLRETTRTYELEHKQLLEQRVDWQAQLAKSQQVVEDTRSLLHQTQLAYDREKIKIQQLAENVKRDELRLEMLSERMERLTIRFAELEAPEESLTASLNEKILKHQELEEQLNHSRDNLNVLTRQVEEFEQLSRTEEKKGQVLQEQIQQIQMQEQTLAVRANGMLEALNELDYELKEILDNIPENMTQVVREQNLAEVGEKIKRLGAINLAAIEEYESEYQRKQHLDEQYQDLTEALATLDAAIEKMDKETLVRLRNTFEEVNTAFQSLFPRLFGGGRAMLELTCDNLLEAGIVVMAQPPGKRNSTIHLLSGGEKAMTAVALVFAIFQLNPSPFCMLDEVDAPLDDVNVGRFCTLVKEMSQFVQFLFITHNKVTMELADHLIGVTMREPGVSRIVAVDVEQALSMSTS